ncbi:nitroreductase family protein [Falsirhodobacter halotolerans]|uniref:nitroreductase family protein n=1 Tax=Falsirhodobacter halotolerans TaxID=1146892 RepID=UPI001FD060A4|nr:nitroreductase [Falsirhodobacter halotolerans]MCJ8139839.1 nitroreductase [Falsirhodobacter halotolerans]
MPVPNPAVTEFLMSRRSRPAKTLAAPVPTREDLGPILTAAARTPDHGMLQPWRFIVLPPAAMPRIADLAESFGTDDTSRKKGRKQFELGTLAVAVIASPKPSDKIPQMEQILSAGAVCLALLNAAQAAGWGANWLTGWVSHHAAFGAAFGLTEGEFIAGFIHIGTETMEPADRPRPDIDALTTWIGA